MRLSGGLALLLVLLVGCGDDDDAVTRTSTTEPATTSTTEVDGTTEADSTTEAGGEDEDGEASDAGEDGPADPSGSTEATTSTRPAPEGPPTLDEGSSVSTVGLDTVHFGMTLADAEEAAGTRLLPEGPTGRCTVVAPEEGPPGIRFTLVDGTVERVDVSEGPVTTRSGIGVGSSEQDVRDRYGDQVEVSPRPDGTGNDLVFVPRDEADAAFRVVFSTDGATVTSYRAGRVPVVLPAAPCGALDLPGQPGAGN